MACYTLKGSLSEPQTAAIVTFARQCLAAEERTHTHTYRLTHTSWTHRVMMGLSSSIRACSSRLGSRAESVELDSSQEVFSFGFEAAWPMRSALQAAERPVIVLR